jgi:hypothetical protein
VQYLRGHGVADLAAARDGGPLRVSAELAFHVLEVLEAIETASGSSTVVRIGSRPARPEPAAAATTASTPSTGEDVPAHV